MLALDNRHLEEFTAHIVPTNQHFAVAPDPSTGNYASIVDHQARCVAHPIDYLQWGLGRDGQPLPYAARSEDIGVRPTRLDLLDFEDENLARIPGLTAQGQAGSIEYHWAGRDKFVAYAPIPYYGGDYAPPAGFGWVAIGADATTFHEPASLVAVAFQDKFQALLHSALGILVTTGVVILLIAGVLAHQISGPIRRLTHAVGLVGEGNFEAAHTTAMDIHASDELGVLAAGFGAMITQLQETLLGLEQELRERKMAEEGQRQALAEALQATHDLQKSEERYRTLFDGVPVGLYRTTPTGEIIDVNLEGVKLLAYPDRKSLLTVNAVDLYVNAEDRARWRDLMEQHGIVPEFEVQFRRYDGEVIWVNNISRAIFKGGEREGENRGEVLRYEGSLEDITKRKQVEMELNRHRERLEELVDQRTAELRKAVEDREREIAERKQAEGALDGEMAKRLPLRILLVEDNLVNQKLALRILGRLGYHTDLAANGIEALQAMERQAYDVILMDVQMPEMDGLDATRCIRRDVAPQAQPHIIAMTANAMQEDREICLLAGMDDYLSKPIRIWELVAALKKCSSASTSDKVPCVESAEGGDDAIERHPPEKERDQ